LTERKTRPASRGLIPVKGVSAPRRDKAPMHVYLPDLAHRPVPRYTSYPTADRFQDGISPSDQRAALEAIKAGERVSLYVHIPYCREICWYCGCNTQALGRADRLIRYVDGLATEIAAVAQRMRGRVHSIHFGGGSPNALPPATFEDLLGRLRTSFAVVDHPEIAVELDPRLIEPAFVAVLARTGTTRVSLGVQTFARHVQRAIGRIQPLALVQDGFAMLREAGIDAINVDLLYGLPGQHVSDVAETIDAVVALRPNRIALFGYAHVPHMMPRQRAIDAAMLPSAEARFLQAAHGHDGLVAAGYRAIGFDHFALPDDPLAVAAAKGTLRRNFQGFTADPIRTVVGLGASAISQFDGLLAQNEKDVGRYLATVRESGLAARRGIVRTAEDRLRAALIERLLCDGALDIGAVERQHRALLAGRDRVEARLSVFEDRGLIRRDRGV
jgi:oxygen-independent coproporphyrinogen-3 oxidase